ncbi:GTPase Era [Gulosibacter chungangensis]|uniref:GTPase Era n=1 Tax=Gulosibacter chungangensis TaxID=979746 RepID=A0A7J5BCU0_9MICO|nr:GTPase Era [Gulosibacter chungangensis]KAB1643631.1 GTPase Era [Gulosibacter chungangensis]
MNEAETQPTGAEPAAYRAGFVTFVGRPNVGKSTLTNALVGEKIVITSDKPQTTRRAIRGIVHRPNGQIIIVDTPGIHRPRTLLGQRLNDIVEEVLTDVDVVGFCIPADEPIGPGDRMINEWLDRAPQAKKVALVTKCELVPKPEVAKQLMEIEMLRDWDVIIPVSSTEQINLEPLIEELIGLFPESPQLYPDGMITEETYSQRVAELIRESALHGVHDELPHSIAVMIEDMWDEEDEGEEPGRRQIHANIYVERDSQKGIIIGKNGQRLKNVRQFASRAITAISDRRVSLTLHVKVAKDWQRDAKQLGRLGF